MSRYHSQRTLMFDHRFLWPLGDCGYSRQLPSHGTWRIAGERSKSKVPKNCWIEFHETVQRCLHDLNKSTLEICTGHGRSLIRVRNQKLPVPPTATLINFPSISRPQRWHTTKWGWFNDDTMMIHDHTMWVIQCEYMPLVSQVHSCIGNLTWPAGTASGAFWWKRCRLVRQRNSDSHFIHTQRRSDQSNTESGK